jgi:small nuclear ribonucleoprotein (snRNP)-like protein
MKIECYYCFILKFQLFLLILIIINKDKMSDASAAQSFSEQLETIVPSEASSSTASTVLGNNKSDKLCAHQHSHEHRDVDHGMVASGIESIIKSTKRLAVSDEIDTPSKLVLRQYLNRNMKVKITDGRVLVGIFLCTDKQSNIILGSCQEFVDIAGYLLVILTNLFI